MILDYARASVLAFFQLKTSKKELLKQLDRAMVDPSSAAALESQLANVKHKSRGSAGRLSCKQICPGKHGGNRGPEASKLAARRFSIPFNPRQDCDSHHVTSSRSAGLKSLAIATNGLTGPAPPDWWTKPGHYAF
jgi:hypothetical protein